MKIFNALKEAIEITATLLEPRLWGRHCVKGFPGCISFIPQKNFCPILEMRKQGVGGHLAVQPRSQEWYWWGHQSPGSEPLSWKGHLWGITLGHAWHPLKCCSKGPPAVSYWHPTWSSGQDPGREGSISLPHRQRDTFPGACELQWLCFSFAARGATRASIPACQIGLPDKRQGAQLDLNLTYTMDNILVSRKLFIAYLKFKFHGACCIPDPLSMSFLATSELKCAGNGREPRVLLQLRDQISHA